MRVAVRHDAALVDPEGHVAGHDAGATLVRRLLRVFPGSVLVGPGPRHADGFDVLPLDFVDGTDTVVITMDVVDGPEIWRTLRAWCPEPRVMNFVWWSPSPTEPLVQRAAFALSCALFPTFANSRRTAAEVQEVVTAGTVPALAERSRIAWADLGIRLEHVRPRQATPVPVVLYPAIQVSERKQPRLFLDVVESVARRMPIRVEARLDTEHLAAEEAMRLSRHPWAWVGPLTARREDYWDALARTTAFLATSVEESYGLEYVEALVAGAIGVLPDRPWVHALVPAGYPFLYRTAAEAEELLVRALTDPDGCRLLLDRCAGGDFAAWLRRHHDDDVFEAAVVARVREWFGD